jgi:NADPH-dependent glutamate synthase beta subunit-like oxidoreductase
MSMQKPFAITLDPGSSLANKTGSWRTERPVYVDRLPPCNGECPAGEDIQGWLFHAESGNYEAAWRHLTRDNPFPAIMGASAITPARACATAPRSTRGRHQLGRALPGDEALKNRWRFESPQTETGATSSSSAADRRDVGRLPPAPPRPRVTVMEAGPMLGGMMRFGIPKYRLPRDVLDARCSASSRWA